MTDTTVAVADSKSLRNLAIAGYSILGVVVAATIVVATNSDLLSRIVFGQ